MNPRVAPYFMLGVGATLLGLSAHDLRIGVGIYFAVGAIIEAIQKVHVR